MAKLSKTENAILEAILNDPFISQAKIATDLNLARSTIAVQISQLIDKGLLAGRGYILPKSQKVVCIGGIAFNRKYSLSTTPVLGTSNPAISTKSYGGVIRNIAENMARMDVDVCLISIIGNDESGKELRSQIRNLGVDTSQISISNDKPTAEYIAIFDDKNELVMGIASMDILDQITPSLIEESWSSIRSSDWVILDCNLPKETIEKILEIKENANFMLAVDTVSVSKAKRLPSNLSQIDILFTNKDEAISVLGLDDNLKTYKLDEITTQLRSTGAKGVVLTDGPNGHLVNIGNEAFTSPAISSNVKNVSGAGDAFVAGFISTIRSGSTVREASNMGAALSALTVESHLDVRQDLNNKLLSEYLISKKIIKEHL
jgi:pseudouridine kinase